MDREAMDEGDEDTETDDDEESTDKASVDEGSSMTTAKSARECNRLNQTRLQLEGVRATFKWCTSCFADLALDMYHIDVYNKTFGRKSHCKTCCKAKRKTV